jgi:hypothetical protein
MRTMMASCSLLLLRLSLYPTLGGLLSVTNEHSRAVEKFHAFHNTLAASLR